MSTKKVGRNYALAVDVIDGERDGGIPSRRYLFRQIQQFKHKQSWLALLVVKLKDRNERLQLENARLRSILGQSQSQVGAPTNPPVLPAEMD